MTLLYDMHLLYLGPNGSESSTSPAPFSASHGGSASRNPVTGSNCVGFSVVSDSAVLRSGPLPHHLSAQAADLIALTEVCKLAKDKSVSIYTDSRYAFGVVHDFGALWRHRKFLTSSGKQIAHHNLISELLLAIMLPSWVAIC